MSTPEPSLVRPRIVDVAFWLWLLAAVLIFLNGLAGVTASFGAVRKAAKPEVTDRQVHDLVVYFRAWGVLCIVLALALAYLARRTYQGHRRFRRALIALSIVSVLGAIAMAVFGGSVGPVLLVAALSLIAAGVLVIRPSAQAWFEEAEHA